ncbi:MAG TPA: Nif3-like dinuclear metal center hexameric protein [Desulfobacterales bacterium]|nr:Nif3-like dinuclear metal center hexameric protein [Desulfobacterales bacterium]
MGCIRSTPSLFSMSAKVGQILALVEEQAPVSLALPWDRVGLAIGSLRQEVDKLVVALEASEAVLHGAVEVGAQMVLSHHPLLFKPVERFCPDRPLERAISFAIKHDLVVAAAHTNLDVAVDGLNDYLVRVLNLGSAKPLEITQTEAMLKLSVFTPVGYEDRIREAICGVGAGVIGRYEHCSFAARGEGTYRPLPGAGPWRQDAEGLTRAVESRLEVVLPERLAESVLRRLKAVHPYEEVAYDLYPLKNPGMPLGIGRIGQWSQPRSFEQVLVDLKQLFKVPFIKVAGRTPSKVQRVAVCGGSGGDLIERAWEQGAEIFITGDIRYHQAVPWAQERMAILDLGHFATEVLFIPEWGRRLGAALAQAHLPLEIVPDSWGSDPFRYV